MLGSFRPCLFQCNAVLLAISINAYVNRKSLVNSGVKLVAFVVLGDSCRGASSTPERLNCCFLPPANTKRMVSAISAAAGGNVDKTLEGLACGKKMELPIKPLWRSCAATLVGCSTVICKQVLTRGRSRRVPGERFRSPGNGRPIHRSLARANLGKATVELVKLDLHERHTFAALFVSSGMAFLCSNKYLS